MDAQSKFQALLTKEGIRHFTAAEVFFRGASNARLQINTDPPEEMWPKIIPTLKVLDKLRDHLAYPIKLLSIYRAPAYNRAIGGETHSYHMKFQACDFHCDCNDPKVWSDALRDMRARGEFLGGIGQYGSFVHVDTRGYNASWNG